jgi:hypothetical protein
MTSGFWRVLTFALLFLLPSVCSAQRIALSDSTHYILPHVVDSVLAEWANGRHQLTKTNLVNACPRSLPVSSRDLPEASVDQIIFVNEISGQVAGVRIDSDIVISYNAHHDSVTAVEVYYKTKNPKAVFDILYSQLTADFGNPSDMESGCFTSTRTATWKITNNHVVLSESYQGSVSIVYGCGGW